MILASFDSIVWVLSVVGFASLGFQVNNLDRVPLTVLEYLSMDLGNTLDLG